MKLKQIDNYIMVKTAEKGKLSAVASTAALDRDGEVILPSAFAGMLDRYRANPVIMAAHTHRSMDGMPTIIGSADKIEIENDSLVFEMRFAKTDVAKAWQSLYEDKHARAFSVGFIPVEGQWKEQGGDSVYVHTAVELLEISAVAVPANPEAVTRGIDPDEINKIVDARVKQALEKWYASLRLKAAIERTNNG